MAQSLRSFLQFPAKLFFAMHYSHEGRPTLPIFFAGGFETGRAASRSPSSPCGERAGRGETAKNALPLPSRLLHSMEEREKSSSLMQAVKRENKFSASTTFPFRVFGVFRGLNCGS